jgi:transposase
MTGSDSQRGLCCESEDKQYRATSERVGRWLRAVLATDQDGVQREVVAPTLVPVKPGDRVKTDRRDALKLARNYRARELTAAWVPDAAHEALRDLVRAREAAKKDELRARMS